MTRPRNRAPQDWTVRYCPGLKGEHLEDEWHLLLDDEVRGVLFDQADAREVYAALLLFRQYARAEGKTPADLVLEIEAENATT